MLKLSPKDKAPKTRKFRHLPLCAKGATLNDCVTCAKALPWYLASLPAPTTDFLPTRWCPRFSPSQPAPSRRPGSSLLTICGPCGHAAFFLSLKLSSSMSTIESPEKKQRQQFPHLVSQTSRSAEGELPVLHTKWSNSLYSHEAIQFTRSDPIHTKWSNSHEVIQFTRGDPIHTKWCKQNRRKKKCERQRVRRSSPRSGSRDHVIFYYDCQTILQTMTFGSSILIRFRGVHSHRSHSDTVAVLSSKVHLAQESRTNHKSNHKISKDTSYMRHSVRRAPPWVWVMPMGAWLSWSNIAHLPWVTSLWNDLYAFVRFSYHRKASFL